MEQLNRIELIGYCGTVRTMEMYGKKGVTFQLSTSLLLNCKEPTIECTWHQVVAWEGESIKDLDKISQKTKIHVTGRLRPNRYTGADGIDRMTYEVVASSLSIISSEEKLDIQTEQ